MLVAAVCATLPTFVSLAGAGAGAPRLNGGPWGKTERCAVVVVATAFPALLGLWAGLIVVGSAHARPVLRLRRVRAVLA